MNEDYRNYPESLTERKAHKTSNAADWTPRDALIDTLRLIDSGEINPEALVISWFEYCKQDNTAVHTGYRVASKNRIVTLGLLQMALKEV